MSYRVNTEIDLDYVLVHELGQFGRFQMFNLVLMTVPLTMAAFFGEFVFTAADIPHRCSVPECEEKGTSVFQPVWINDAIPVEDSKLSSCLRYANINSTSSFQGSQCSGLMFNKTAIVACNSYVYKHNNTIVYDFDIGCSEWLRTLPGMLNGIGCLLALPMVGYFSDRFGRRLALIISVLNCGIFGLLRAFSVNYTMYAALELLQTTAGSGVYSTAYILATELSGPEYRMATGTIAITLFSLGGILLGCLAYLIQQWRYLTSVVFLPCFLAVPLYLKVLKESVRWLLSKQKYSEAKRVLESVAKINRKEIKEETMQSLMKTPSAKNDSRKTSLVSSILSSPVLLRRVCITPIWWVATTSGFYGLTVISTSLSDNMYLDYILVGVVEIPGFVFSWMLLDRVGRKPVFSGGFFLSAICNLLAVVVPSGMTSLRLGLVLAAKFGISMVFNCVYLFTSELYPTEHRHTLLGFSSMIGRIGNILAPMTPALSQYWSDTPLALFGVLSLIAGLLTLTQPETLGTKLPDTLQEAEQLGKRPS